MGIWGRSGRAASDTRDRRSRGPEPRALLVAPPPFPPQVTTLFSSSEPLRPQLTALSSDAGTRCPEEAASLTPNHRPRKSPPRPPQKRGGPPGNGGNAAKPERGGAPTPAAGRTDPQGSKPPEARVHRLSRRRKRPACRTLPPLAGLFRTPARQPAQPRPRCPHTHRARAPPRRGRPPPSALRPGRDLRPAPVPGPGTGPLAAAAASGLRHGRVRSPRAPGQRPGQNVIRWACWFP
ncbi:proline-rich protein HaeIII subfamily 1-like [Ursus maritimus]|uniref:Proline-rich protein HaeIII subfamily 1-like n=1 Tax=Ursus maritimus TaxID=29073 RepID=A0A8M1GQ51_URSMA|nr:proline-rich protein HaeIII subfamily 1-like [Ursus maritimus]XP_048076120.2 proline-rich protein HaeIII subfamily 1-like [Ursus arctos]